MAPYELLLWDFDGTIADSLASGARIYNQIAKRHGFKPIEDFESVRRLKTTEFLKRHEIGLLKIPAAMRDFVAIQKEEMASIGLCPGVRELLGSLAGRGYRLGILSSNAAENIQTCLRANNVAERFEFVVGYSRLFGKDRGLRKVANDLKLGVDRILYIGDESRDIEAAHKVKMDCCAVTWGCHHEVLLAPLEPTYLIDRPDQLPQILDDRTRTASIDAAPQ